MIFLTVKTHVTVGVAGRVENRQSRCAKLYHLALRHRVIERGDSRDFRRTVDDRPGGGLHSGIPARMIGMPMGIEHPRQAPPKPLGRLEYDVGVRRVDRGRIA